MLFKRIIPIFLIGVIGSLSGMEKPGFDNVLRNNPEGANDYTQQPKEKQKVEDSAQRTCSEFDKIEWLTIPSGISAEATRLFCDKTEHAIEHYINRQLISSKKAQVFLNLLENKHDLDVTIKVLHNARTALEQIAKDPYVNVIQNCLLGDSTTASEIEAERNKHRIEEARK